MTPASVADVLTVSDWLAFFGVIVAAVLGVGVAVWGQWAARRAAYRDRVDGALAAVIVALGRRSIELDEWASPAEVPVAGSLGMRATRGARHSETGGPLDAELQTTVEAAWLAARKRPDRECIEALANAVFEFKVATVSWQISRLGMLAADVRRWRTGEASAERFRHSMESFMTAPHNIGRAADEKRAAG